jgi:hypothetical protein
MITIIKSMHVGARAVVRVDGVHSEPFTVEAGLRQGCTLAPILAIIFMAVIVQSWRDEAEPSVVINSDLVSFNLKVPVASRRMTVQTPVADVEFADDVTGVDNSKPKAIDRAVALDRTTGRYGLDVAWAKTKYVSVGCESVEDITFVDRRGDTQTIEGVNSFVCLGSAVNKDATMDAEVEYRISRATKSYYTLRKRVFRNAHLTLFTKATVYRVTVLQALLYASECWYNLNKVRHLRRLEAFHMQCVRDMTNVFRMQQHDQHIRNDDLRHRLRIETISELLRQRQLRWVGHIGRASNDSLMKQATFSWLPNATRKSRTRAPRQSFAAAIHQHLKYRRITQNEWYNIAQDRNYWRRRAVFGLRDGEHAGSDSEDDEAASKQLGRKQAYICNRARSDEEQFVPFLRTDGTWGCPFPGCTREPFSSKRGAAIHYGHAHGKAARDSAMNDYEFRCAVCNRPFRTRQGRSIHVARMHAEQP